MHFGPSCGQWLLVLVHVRHHIWPGEIHARSIASKNTPRFSPASEGARLSPTNEDAPLSPTKQLLPTYDGALCSQTAYPLPLPYSQGQLCGTTFISPMMPQEAVRITVPSSMPVGGTLVVDTLGTAWDTVLVALGEAYPGRLQPGCLSTSAVCYAHNDDARLPNGQVISQSNLSFIARPGQSYTILIGGYSSLSDDEDEDASRRQQGPFNLNWRYLPPTSTPTSLPCSTVLPPRTPRIRCIEGAGSMLQLSQPADVCAAGVTPLGSSIFYPVNFTEATREAFTLQLRLDAASLLLQSKLKGLYVCNTDGCNSPALPACTMSTAPTCAAPVGRVIQMYGPSGSSGAASMSVFGGTSSMYAGETCSGALPIALSGPRVTYRIQLPSSMPLNG